MSIKERINHSKKSNNNIRNSALVNEKLSTRSFPKKSSLLSSERKTKKSYNVKFSSLKINMDKESDEFNLSLESQDTVYKENREKQLEILNEKYSKLYSSKEKIYSTIIKEIDIEKHLFYKGSIMSFNLIILKIKCYMKLLKEKFEYTFNSKDERNYYEIDSYIQKIKNLFKTIYSMIHSDNKYEYEIITQVYCKFLYILSIISNQKEEFIRSFNFICLGVNMLKVFFFRQKIGADIETYKIYAKLIIFLINKLIGDHNISQALIYISLLSKICEIGLNIVYKNKLDKRYEYKFNKLNGFNFLFLGYCFELKNNNPNNSKITLKAYEESFYFMSKTYKSSIFGEVKTTYTIEKKGLNLSQFLYEKLKDKLVYEALEKQREYEQQEKIKKQLLEEAKSKEKKYKLKLISSGLTPDPKNLVVMQHKIYKEILTPNNQKLIDKLDDELISYVYKDRPNQNDSEKKEAIKIKNTNINGKKLSDGKKCGKLEKRLPSTEIMKNLCHYKIYNSLMSRDFKEFLLNNKNLEFNNPQKEKISLDKIQKFLNRKMEIGTNSENNKKGKSREKKNHVIINTETNLSSENKIKSKILNLKNFNQKNKFKTDELTKDNTSESNYENFNPFKTSQKLNSRNKHSFIISRDKVNDKEKNNNLNSNRVITYSNYTASIINKSNSHRNKNEDKKRNSKSMLTTGSVDLENRKLDKYIFNNKYFNEYVYFDKLTNKELSFQKQFLESKNNNSKMYFRGFYNELNNNGKISREDIYNSFLILNNNIVSKDRNYEKEAKAEIEIKNKPKIVGNVFKSVTNKMKEGKEVKNAMRKVLDRYIDEQRKTHIYKNKNMNRVSVEEINKKNEFSIMKLNDNIKEINYLLLAKNNEAKINHQNNNFLGVSDL